MKHTALVRSLGLLALASVLAGCATPASRIKRNPELFNSLPPEVQQGVQEGRVEIGYPRDAVRLALGAPNREYTRRTGDGTVQVWSYTKEYTTTERQRVNARMRAPDESGRVRTFSDWFWVDIDRRHEYERLRIEFEDDRVTAIETLDR